MRLATLFFRSMLALAALAAPNLHVAAYKDDVKVIRDQLRLGVDVNLKSDEGDRALHVAVAKGSVNAVAALLEAGAGPVDEVIEEDGRTLLDFARDKAKEVDQHKKVLEQHKKVLKLLIDAADEEAWLDGREPPSNQTTEIPLKFEFKDVKSGTRPRSDTPAEESTDETLQAQIAKKFAALDANSDGLLDPEEMRAAEEEVKAAEQKSGGTNMGGTPADLYAQADADGDGLISLAELSQSLTALAQQSAAGGGPDMSSLISEQMQKKVEELAAKALKDREAKEEL